MKLLYWRREIKSPDNWFAFQQIPMQAATRYPAVVGPTENQSQIVSW